MQRSLPLRMQRRTHCVSFKRLHSCVAQAEQSFAPSIKSVFRICVVLASASWSCLVLSTTTLRLEKSSTRTAYRSFLLQPRSNVFMMFDQLLLLSLVSGCSVLLSNPCANSAVATQLQTAYSSAHHRLITRLCVTLIIHRDCVCDCRVVLCTMATLKQQFLTSQNLDILCPL